MEEDIKSEITETRIKELETRNRDELESLEKLIILIEDMKNIETSNLKYAEEVLKDVSFDDKLIIGKLGSIVKSYIESYYSTKQKQAENLKKLISILKLNKAVSEDAENENENETEPHMMEQKYIGKKDIANILGAIPIINDYNKENEINYNKFVGEKIDNLKNMDGIEDLNILKIIKEEKCIFEQKIEDICIYGTNSQELDELKNIIASDDSKEQEKCIWTINYLNKYRAKLSTIDIKVYNAFTVLFDIIFTKLEEKEIFQYIDLGIILIQTFSKTENNNNILLENEFKKHKAFQNENIWINLIKQKTMDLVSKIGEENKDNIQYIKENIEPILISYIFTMKDFSVDDITRQKVIEDFCNLESNKEYKFDIETLLSYSED